MKKIKGKKGGKETLTPTREQTREGFGEEKRALERNSSRRGYQTELNSNQV